MRDTKPMLAAKEFLPLVIQGQLPMYMQPKLDGIRMRVIDGRPISRSNKLIPNKFIQEWVREYKSFIEGYDGELIVGSPTAKDAYNKTSSGVMSHDGQPKFQYYVYDLWNSVQSFRDRSITLRSEISAASERGEYVSQRLEAVDTQLVYSLEDIYHREAALLVSGYEGAVLRGPSTLYKEGRATSKQGQLIKLKRFLDAEARIVGFEELLHNDNEAYIGELGQTKRSSHQENMVAGDTMGTLVCKGTWPNGAEYDVNVGSGFSQDLRKKIWNNQQTYQGQWVKFKYFEVGTLNRPRHPIFLGFRDPIDM